VDSAVPLILCALLGAGAVLLRGPAARGWAMLGALALTPVILISHIWDSSQLAPLRDHPLYAVVLGLVAVGIVGLAAWLARDRPAWLVLAAAAALPFRIPISSGGSTANLLVPLYAVMAAAVLGHAVPRILGRIDAGAPGEDRRPVPVEWALMGYVVLYAIQASYSADSGHALEQVVFFYVPFALLYAVLVRVRWTKELAVRALAIVVGLAVVLVAIGFVEYATRTLLLNPKVISSNQFSDYFRVNSLFFDPNIYGRFLAMVMLGVVATVMWARRARTALVGALVLAYLWAGLVLTLSQSSFTALLAGLVVLAALRWRPSFVLAGAGLAALAAVVFLVAAGDRVHLDLSSANQTSGRSSLVSGGVDLFKSAPIVGHGSGSFAREYREAHHDASSQRAASASHTIPVTVAAEQGIVGLALYLAVVVLALLTLLRGARGDPVRAAIAAAFVALLVHTLLYAAFLEDPLAWVLLAAGVSLTRPGELRSRLPPERRAGGAVAESDAP
jgi:O-antigen ligase